MEHNKEEESHQPHTRVENIEEIINNKNNTKHEELNINIIV